jgi:spermidine/putrescine transport system substrate-binding protein
MSELGEFDVPVDSGLTRGQLLRRAGMLGVALGVAPGLASSAWAAEESRSLSGAIDYFSWQGYDLKGVPIIDAWVKKNGLTFNASYISGNPDILAKLKNPGGVTYDLTTIFQGLSNQFRQLNLLNTLDLSKIPNVKNYYPLFRSGVFPNTFWGKGGEWIAAPFTWGQAALNYRSDITNPPTKWTDLLQPRFKGKIGCQGGPDGAVFIASAVQGYDPSRLTPKQFNDVFAFLRQIRSQARAVGQPAGELAELLASGDIVATFNGWSFVDVLAAKKGAKVSHVVPEAGSYSYCDSYAIPRTADNTDASYAFINEALSTPAQIQISAFLAQATPCKTAYAGLTPAEKKAYPYANVVAATKAAPFYAMPPFESTSTRVGYLAWLSEWAKLKAGK